MNEAELLFTEIFNCDRLSLYLNKDSILEKDKSDLVCSVLKKRISGVPLHYLLGKIEFMGLDFKVTPDVLIPRPETEILVENVIRLARNSGYSPSDILDMGTGSGCIAVSLAKSLSGIKIWAADISLQALDVARANAVNHKLEINFVQSDLFNADALKKTRYDIIVTNPPYIARNELKKLSAEIQHEPALALDAGEDGLDFYRRMTFESPEYLKEGGFLLMEIGLNQLGPVKNIFLKSPSLKIIQVIKDYSGIDRVVVARKEKEQTWIN